MACLALSGGGVRGGAHVGVLKALEENHIKIDHIAGTSAGSIVALLYAIGCTPDEMLSIFQGDGCPHCDYDLKRGPFHRHRQPLLDYDIGGMLYFVLCLLLGRKISLSGFIKGDAIEQLLQRECEKRGILKLSQTPIPVVLPAVDLEKRKTILFASDPGRYHPLPDQEIYGDIAPWEAVRASISFPVIFLPKQWKGRKLVDGGLMENLPVDVLKTGRCGKVIAVDLGKSQNKNAADNIFDIASRSMDILSYMGVRDDLQAADCLLKPEIEGVSLLQLSKLSQCVEIGYQAAIGRMDAIRGALGIVLV